MCLRARDKFRERRGGGVEVVGFGTHFEAGGEERF